MDGQRSGPWTSEGALRTPGREPVRSLYVHVPFCFHKCHYCDFYSFVDNADRQGAFTDALIAEARALGDAEREATGEAPALETLFVGGGTPTLLALEHWERLADALHDVFAIDARTEWTVECNPETATPELMRLLAGAGVNRLSVGAQSFDERHLRTLERWHDPSSVERALGLARNAGITRLSLDLIYAIPGQTLGEWEADLGRALAIGTGHVSAYALTYEPNTAMTKRLERAEFEPADEDVEVAMFRRTAEVLADAGLERYETSNYASADARSGGACAHNLAYWRQRDWHALGPSASAHVAGHRWKNVPRLTDWMTGVARTGGFAPVVDLETPDPARALAERIMTGLRLREGLDAREMLAQARALGRDDALRGAAERCASNGWLDERAGRWVLTDEGQLFADGAASRLMRAIV